MSELHPEGRYLARAVDGAWGRTGTGIEQVAVLFKLETDRQLTWYGYLTDKTSERTMNSLITCGVTDLETLAGLDTNEVELVIEHDTYNGKTTAKVLWVNALGSGGVHLKDKIEGSEKAGMLAKHKGNFLKLQRAAGVAPGVSQTKTGPNDNDDIPF
jgi:hypothetical protein